MPRRRFPDGGIDARIRPKIQRIIISRPFKIRQGLNGIGQRQIAIAHPKL